MRASWQRTTRDEDRADGAEIDWLYQRRHGETELHDPWAPEMVEVRKQHSLGWPEEDGPEDEDGDCAPWNPDDPNGPEDDRFDPAHDIA